MEYETIQIRKIDGACGLCEEYSKRTVPLRQRLPSSPVKGPVHGGMYPEGQQTSLPIH